MNNSRSFLLASSQFPSGVAWLLNFFIEIDVLTYRGESVEEMWTRRENGSYALNGPEKILKQWIPALSDSGTYTFENGVTVRWSHDFPTRKKREDKVILVVRDGRDAVHSLFKRADTGEPLLHMLRSTCIPMNLTPPETWALFNYLWVASTTPQDLFIVRFDELKATPIPVVKELLSFMGIERTQPVITHAVASSGFDRARQAEERYKKENGAFVGTINRKGALREWGGVYGPPEQKAFGNFPSLVLAWLGYEVSLPPQETTKEEKVVLDINTIKSWNQADMLKKLPIIAESYRKAPRLKKYWRRFVWRQRRIGVQGSVIRFLKKRRWDTIYTILKKSLDVYRFSKRQYYDGLHWVRSTRAKLRKRRDINHYRTVNNVKIFVETGTYKGEMVLAFKNAFREIYSVELDSELTKKARALFASDTHVTIMEGDSAIVLPEILKKVGGPALFWLDAHYSGGETALADKETPIVSELRAIADHSVKNHTILIDDARCFDGTHDYPPIDVLRTSAKKLFPTHSFFVAKDIIHIIPTHDNN